MLRQIGKSFWHYWKWLCVALVTTSIILGAIALLLGGFTSGAPVEPSPATTCLDQGGAWDDALRECKMPA